ncbi:M20/M25/M40 family metallo-hydrolase [bacterium]|nr:M20/M25/M40 family metallo-hydrolase [bacterium]
MNSKRRLSVTAAVVVLLTALSLHAQNFPATTDDPALRNIIEIGQTDNKTMTWLDYFTNRFGGRYIGSDAYTNAANWAVYQFHSWGVQAELQEVGEMPVGFNRGPWFGKMTAPEEKSLYFGTPSYTAGTKGVQRGGVAIAPGDSLKILDMKDSFRDKWVLISDAGDFAARSGRGPGKPFLETVLEEAGALGSIMSARVPLQILNANVDSWDTLPILPDIRLDESQYKEIKDLVEKGEAVELEFEIRNWFKMGPVKYHNVVAWIPGTEHPDEYLIMSGHLDAFDGGTGAVDCGSGITPAMEAMRLLAKSGVKPKRTIMAILFAGEEAGILGASAWVKQNPSKLEKIAVLMNRDYTPGAITGITVPASWEEDFQKIVKPLEGLNEEFPFEGITVNPYPGPPSTRLGGTDASAFQMVSVPTIRFREESGYSYRRAWHTLYDTYNEVVPYSRHQEHTALCLAIIAYGIGNLDHLLSREGIYLDDGLYADINTDKGRMIVELDYRNAPLTAASFTRLFESERGGRRGMRGFFGRGSRPPAIGVFGRDGTATLISESILERADKKLRKEANPDLKHDDAGVLGMMDGRGFYLTTKKMKEYDGRFTPIGQVMVGRDIVKTIAAGDSLRGVSIIRVGEKAAAFNN